MLTRVAQLATKNIRYAFTQCTWEYLPRPYNISKTKKEKILDRSPELRPFPKYAMDFNDSLHIPGLDGQGLFNIYEQFVENKDSPLSAQFVALMLYNFSKKGYLNPLTWAKLEPYIGRNRGQYSMRSIFGCLYSCIRFGKEEYIRFFIEEMQGQKLGFSDMEAVEIVEAFNESSYPYSLQFKHSFWETYFKPFYLNEINQSVRVHKMATVFRIFDAFNKFEYYQDEQLWENIFGWMERRRGWIRTDIIERLYPLTGTFPRAKEIFDKYYAELSNNKHIQWRYNLEELRLYTSEEMIAKSQIDIKMHPSDRTIFNRKDQKELNESYHEWLKDGARQKEAELVRDKAQSLAYAIKNRYDSLKKDNVDFSKLTMEEFDDLFGNFDQNLVYRAPEGEKDEELEFKL